MTEKAILPISLLLDRLLNASDGSDARTSLKQLQTRSKLPSNNDNDVAQQRQRRTDDVLEIANNYECHVVFCSLIERNELPRSGQTPLKVEDGAEYTCELLQEMLTSLSTAGTEPSNSNNKSHSSHVISRQATEHKVAKALLTISNDKSKKDAAASTSLVSSLLDLLCDNSTTSSTSSSSYPRILSMQLLSRLYVLQPNLTQNAIIATPEGLNRLVDLFSSSSSSSSSSDEIIRNEVLVLLNTLASQSTTIQKLLLFAEGMERALSIATEPETNGGCGGLLGNNGSVILDCLTLIEHLMGSSNGMDMFLTTIASTASSSGGGGIYRTLLDCRRTREVIYKDYFKDDLEGKDTTNKKSKKGSVTMEELLADDKTKESASSSAGTSAKMKTRGPMLTETEDEIVQSTLRLILQCISSEDDDDNDDDDDMEEDASASEVDPTVVSRRLAVMKRRLAIASYTQLTQRIVSMALYRPPPPLPMGASIQYVASAPRNGSQVLALEVLATLVAKPPKKFLQPTTKQGDSNDPTKSSTTTTTKISQMYQQICEYLTNPLALYDPNTMYNPHFRQGEGSGDSEGGRIPLLQELFRLSSMGTHSSPAVSSTILTVLRHLLTKEEARIMVLHALAPPPAAGPTSPTGSAAPPPPIMSPVLGLSHYVRDCLMNLPKARANHDKEGVINLQRAIVGSCASLGIVLQLGGVTSREIMLKLKLTPPGGPNPNPDAVKEDEDSATTFLQTLVSWLVTKKDGVEDETKSSSGATTTTPMEENNNNDDDDEMVRVALLQLLCDWCRKCPNVVQTMVDMTESLSLVEQLWTNTTPATDTGGSATNLSRSLLAVLIGEWLEYINDNSSDTTEAAGDGSSIGGWSRSHIVSMIQSSRLGLSKYTELLLYASNNKSAAGYWTGNDYEWKHWSKRQSQMVNIIRRRLVQEVTGVGGGDFGTNSTSSENGEETHNPLKELIAQQALELEELKSSLKQTTTKLSLKETECQQWKERCSQYSGGDDAAEQVNQTVTAQQRAMELQEMLDEQQDKMKTLLSSKEEEAQLLRDEVSSLKEELTQTKLDHSTMSEELSGLAQAYNSLEDEYRRVAAGAGGSGGAPVVEQQSRGEASASEVASSSAAPTTRSTTTTTVATTSATATQTTQQNDNRHHHDNSAAAIERDELRNELAQKMEQIKAADDWMKMAMEKMQQMQDENQSLKSQLEEVQTRVQQQPQSNAMNGESHHASSSSKTPAAAVTTKTGTSNAADFFSSGGVSVDAAAASSNDEAAKKALEEHERHMLQQTNLLSAKVDELTVEKKELVEKLKNLQSILNATVTNQESTEQELQGKLAKYQNEISSLKARLVTAEEEAADTKKKAEVSSSKAAAAAESSSSSYKETIASLEEEVSAFRKANEDAQDWIQKALEYQKTQNDEIMALTSQTTSLTEEVQRLKEELQRQQESSSAAAAGEEKITKKKEEELQHEIKQMREEIESLKVQRDEATMSFEGDKIRLSSELEAAKNERDELETNMLNEMTTLKERLSKEESALSQMRMDYESSKAEVERVIEDKEFAENEIKEADERIQELEQQVTELETKLEEANANAESSSKLAELEETTKMQLEELQMQVNELTNERDDLTSKLTEFSDWAETAQKENSELLSSNTTLKEQVDAFMLSETTWQEKFDTLKNEYELLNDEKNDMEQKLYEMETQLAEAQNKIDAAEALWQAKSAKHSEELQALQNEMDLLRQENEQINESELESWKEKYASVTEAQTVLRNEKICLEERLQQLEEDVRVKNDVVFEKEAKIQAMELKLEESASELTTLKMQDEKLKHELQAESDRVDMTQGELRKLQEEYKNRSEEFDAQVHAFEVRIVDLEQEISEKNDALASAEDVVGCYTKELENQATQSTEVVSQWKERSDMLEETVKELEEALQGKVVELREMETTTAEQLEAANEAISLWEARCTELTSQVEKLGEAYGDSHVAELESTIEALNEEIVRLVGVESTLSQELSTERSRVATLETIEREIRQRLEVEQSLVTEERHHIDDLQRELEQIRQDLNAMTVDRDNQIEALASSQQSLNESKQSLYNETSKSSQLQEELTAAQRLVQSKVDEIAHLKTTFNSTEGKASYLKKEVEDCHVIIAQLENELREANESLQARITDEIGSLASQKAEQILRNRIVDLKDALAKEREELRREREAHETSEQTLGQLKSDIAFLVHSGEYDGSEVEEKLHNLVAKVSDERIVKERKVLDELNATIQEMKEELTSSKLELKQAEQVAASSRVARTIAEKEATAAKKENRQLHQSIKRSRAEDFTALGSLKSRIESLEEERDIMTSAHQEEIEILKTNLAKATSEKDRLIHSLHELEASNAAYHTARINGSENGRGTEDEVERLRIEKAQLLATVSQTASKAEQRVRRLLTAQLSSNETEIIVERELRQAAEIELTDKRTKLHEVQERVEELEREIAAAKQFKEKGISSEKEREVLQHKLDCLNAQHESQRDENGRLTEQIQKLEANNAALTKQCQALEIEVRKVIQEKKFDRDVTAEVARLRLEAAMLGNKHVVGGRSDASSPQHSAIGVVPSENGYNGGPSTDSTIEELHDYLLAMTDSMKEERDLYRGLQANNEDLLAVLAQQDLELTSLKKALESLGGQSAVEDAMRDAEETAVDRFGEYIHLG